jgi:hypothetical protein
VDKDNLFFFFICEKLLKNINIYIYLWGAPSFSDIFKRIPDSIKIEFEISFPVLDFSTPYPED